MGKTIRIKRRTKLNPSNKDIILEKPHGKKNIGIYDYCAARILSDIGSKYVTVIFE
jgi:hypothetical protein